MFGVKIGNFWVKMVVLKWTFKNHDFYDFLTIIDLKMANFDTKHWKILIFESKNRENSMEKHISTPWDPKN